MPQLQNGNGPKATPKRLLTVKEAAAYLGRSESAIYHLVARREIPVVRTGRTLRFLRDDLDRLCEKDRA
jgi:excisionase family DNA binding protein